MIRICIGFHVKWPQFLSDFNEPEFSGQIFEKYSNIKFYESLSRGRPVVPCRQTDTQTW